MRTRTALLDAGRLAASSPPTSAATEYLGIIKYLASPEMRGRATGSPELEKAAAYIRDQFRGMNLKPLSGDSYYQDFDVTTSARLGKRNSVTYTTGDRQESLRFQEDFIPLNLSGAGDVSGNVVFAGFGITAPEYNYDDYAGLDVKGKIVVLLRHEPQEFDDKSVFEGKVYTAHSQIFSKAANAKIHGAKAVLMVNDVGSAFRRCRRSGEIRTHRRPRQCRHRVRSGEGRRRQQVARAQRQEFGGHRERISTRPASGIVRSARNAAPRP